MNNYKIYCHTNKINNKKYIGQTKQTPKKRWGKNGYEYIKKQPNSHFSSAILKYGWDNFTHNILYSNLTKEEANLKEQELIAFYNTQDPKYGYNLTAGGSTNTLTKNQKENRRKLNYQMWQDGTFKKSINKSVYCIELDLIFESALDAERATGIDNSSIQKVCKNKLKYAGFMPDGQPIHWIYTNQIEQQKINELKNKSEILKGIKIPIYCFELKELFNSSLEAEQKYGFSSSSIRKCIRGKAKTAGKHPITNIPLHWKECPELIDTKNKLTKEKIKELKR